ncbi:MAG: DEAD/DEAH box helicase [Moraxellaceae bacterium]|nr:MAG: DEAD/DEAH box helicase [Moraxellaceae bacterium]
MLAPKQQGDLPVKFKVEQRVSSVQNTAKKGSIIKVLNARGGFQFYEVLWDNLDLEALPEHELQIERITRTPWDLLEGNSLREYQDFSIATTLHKVRNTASNTISTLQASRTIFMPYQYKPLVKFLNSELKRILIADEVGLGKTIEAGHIMLEMAARGNLTNVLVICTNSLRDKWKMELQEKFNFILKKYDSAKDLIADIKDDIVRSRKSVFGILNYEKFRNEELQKVLEGSNYRFDLLICDEAHKIRNNETQQHKGVAKVVDNSDAVVFLTATPIMTHLGNLHNLIRLLDKEGYDTFDIFNNAVRLNQPFIQAVKKLNSNGSLQQIAEELHSATVVQEMTADGEVFHRFALPVGDLFAQDALYERARAQMLSGDHSIENRVKIQQDLIELNSLNHLYTRTRKKDVHNEENIVYRKARTIPVSLSDEERALYDSVINQYKEENDLGLIQKKRQMSSSIVAFQSTKEQLLVQHYNQNLPDAKFAAFEAILEEVVIRNKKKLIVFAFFTKTLMYLAIKLKEKGVVTEIIYGGIDGRTQRLERFEHDNAVKVLLSSEVGSEGLDLQFCDALVNYDLPWNPMVVEQRIGRIDRVGQRSDVINIYNLIIEGTIEERIHNRLYERIELFEQSIGDLEEILGETEPLGELIANGIEALYKTRLSVAEQNERLDQLRKAIENERVTLQKVRAELQDAFANDIHFQNEIERITQNNRYLTKEEIINYLQSIIRIHLSVIRLNHISEEVSKIIIPANGKTVLFDFIEAYKDAPSEAPELENLYKKFKSTHLGCREIPITFDQNYAYKHRSTEYISAFHPLINAITNYFIQEKFDKNLAYKVAVQAKHFLPEKLVKPGFYILVLYKVIVVKDYGDGRSNSISLLCSLLADLNGESVAILSEDVSDYVHGVVQTMGEQLSDCPELDSDTVQFLRDHISTEMYFRKEAVKKDEIIKFLSSIRRRAEQEINYIDTRIQRAEGMLLKDKAIEAILRSRIEELKQKRKKVLDAQSRATLDVSQSLISVNLLSITE